MLALELGSNVWVLSFFGLSLSLLPKNNDVKIKFFGCCIREQYFENYTFVINEKGRMYFH